MPIYRMCPSCHTKIELGKSCPKGCYKKFEEEKEKWRKEANARYDKYQRKNAEIYHSKEWKKLRVTCMNRCDHICLWTLNKHRKIVKGTVVHHIIEVEEDSSRAYDLSNLILLSDEAHREIHELYKGDKEGIQEELFRLIRLEEKFERVVKG